MFLPTCSCRSLRTRVIPEASLFDDTRDMYHILAKECLCLKRTSEQQKEGKHHPETHARNQTACLRNGRNSKFKGLSRNECKEQSLNKTPLLFRYCCHSCESTMPFIPGEQEECDALHFCVQVSSQRDMCSQFAAIVSISCPLESAIPLSKRKTLRDSIVFMLSWLLFWSPFLVI